MHKGIWWGDVMEGDHFDDPDLDGRIILKGSSRSVAGGMNWIDLAQDGDRCRAVECGNERSAVIKFGEFLD